MPSIETHSLINPLLSGFFYACKIVAGSTSEQIILKNVFALVRSALSEVLYIAIFIVVIVYNGNDWGYSRTDSDTATPGHSTEFYFRSREDRPHVSVDKTLQAFKKLAR